MVGIAQVSTCRGHMCWVGDSTRLSTYRGYIYGGQQSTGVCYHVANRELFESAPLNPWTIAGGGEPRRRKVMGLVTYVHGN